VSVLVLVVGVSQLLIGPGRTGITTDEPTQVERTQNWLDGGDYVPAELIGIAGSADSKYVYGPAFALVAHAVNVISGNEEWGSVSWEQGAALVRHRMAAVFALLTAIVVGLVIAFTTGSRLIGLWAAAALLAIPIWIGMGFFNPKDTPAAAGYTFFTAALILALRPGRERWRPERWDLPVFLLAGFGVFFAVGTRLAMWMSLLLSLLVFALLAIQSTRAGGGPLRWPALIAGSALGLACLIVIYPGAFAHPLAFVTQTLGNSSSYSWIGVTLTAGRLLPEHPPWWYLPAWAFASTPVLIGLAALAGSAATAVSLWRTGRAKLLLARPIGRRQTTALLALGQLLILPVASMVMGSTMYSGLRQHLYMVPALAMLAGLGAAWLLGWNRSRRSGSAWTWILTCGLVLALVMPTVSQLMLFPYDYVYVNPIAGLKGVDDRWEGDYWFASLKEATDKVPAGEVKYCGGVFPDRDFDPDSLRPCPSWYIPYSGQPRRPVPPGPGQRWTLLERRGGSGYPPACTPETAVTRRLWGETLVLSYVVRC